MTAITIIEWRRKLDVRHFNRPGNQRHENARDRPQERTDNIHGHNGKAPHAWRQRHGPSYLLHQRRPDPGPPFDGGHVNKLINMLEIDKTKVERLAICGNPIQLSIFQNMEIRDLAFPGERALKTRGVEHQKRDAEGDPLGESRDRPGREDR